MLIEFKIQLDDRHGVRVVGPAPGQVAGPPQHTLLGTHFQPGAQAEQKAGPGGDQPVDGTGTGGGLGASGSGMVFVLGPIVICGSGPGHTGPGGDQPVDGTQPGGGEGKTPPQ